MIDHMAACEKHPVRQMAERLAEVTAERDAALAQLSEPSAGTDALDKIAALCGCPEWDYPGQVVRDVKATQRALVQSRAREAAAVGVLEDVVAGLKEGRSWGQAIKDARALLSRPGGGVDVREWLYGTCSRAYPIIDQGGALEDLIDVFDSAIAALSAPAGGEESNWLDEARPAPDAEEGS